MGRRRGTRALRSRSSRCATTWRGARAVRPRRSHDIHHDPRARRRCIGHVGRAIACERGCPRGRHGHCVLSPRGFIHCSRASRAASSPPHCMGARSRERSRFNRGPGPRCPRSVGLPHVLIAPRVSSVDVVARSTPQTTLRRLTVIVAIQWMGATLGLPLLPLFLERRHGTPSEVGLVMAAFFVAGIATQFGFGHLADKFGRRLLLVASLVVYGLASVTFLLHVGAPWFALTRAVQGASAGAIEVTSLSAVASLFPQERRGRAISQILAAQLLGLALGPVAGAVATVSDLGWAFFAAGVASIIAAGVALRTDLGDREYDPTPLPKLQWSSQLTGALFAASASGLAVGVYEACWSLLLRSHHASTLQIRLSWTFFALPWVYSRASADGWPTTPIAESPPSSAFSMAHSSWRSTPTSTTTTSSWAWAPSSPSAHRCHSPRSHL